MTKEKFWGRVDRSDTSAAACWEWTSHLFGNGYGFISMPLGRSALAHRIGYALQVGPIPDGMMVLHKCDNRKCVRASHLFLGTCKDNALDASRKGRSPLAKLKPSEVLEIRASFTGKFGQGAALARKYGVSKSTISKILLRHTWVTS